MVLFRYTTLPHVQRHREKTATRTRKQHQRNKSYDSDGLNTIQNKYEIKSVIKTHTCTRISVEIKIKSETVTGATMK